jgi:hypothetical protein
MPFTSENQPPAHKKKRGKDQRTLMLEALGRNQVSEEQFWDRVVQTAMSENESFNQRAMIQEVMMRLAPIPKSVAPTYEFDWDNTASPADKIDRLVDLVSGGDIPADIANMLASTIKSGMDVREVTELAERLAALEKLIAQANKGD